MLVKELNVIEKKIFIVKNQTGLSFMLMPLQDFAAVIGAMFVTVLGELQKKRALEGVGMQQFQIVRKNHQMGEVFGFMMIANILNTIQF